MSGPVGSYSGSGGSDCCPLVVDTLTYISLIAFIGLATYFLNEFIAMSMLAKRRRKRRNVVINSQIIHEGKIETYIFYLRYYT